MHRSRLSLKRSPWNFWWLRGGFTLTPCLIQISFVCIILNCGFFSIQIFWDWSFFGNHSSSESRKAIHFPFDRCTPKLRAEATPNATVTWKLYFHFWEQEGSSSIVEQSSTWLVRNLEGLRKNWLIALSKCFRLSIGNMTEIIWQAMYSNESPESGF